VFHVLSATKNWELNDDNEIEAFLEELAALPFFPAQNEEGSPPQNGGELYVFTTACDAALPSFLLAQQGRPLSLFFVLNAPKERVAHEKAIKGQERYNRGKKTEPFASLLLRNFFAGGVVPRVRWFPRKAPQLNINTGNAMIDYAEIRL
jgi:hypothetical protein